jgi:predicted flap endonuclease-1-like 5' DNA nuclease
LNNIGIYTFAQISKLDENGINAIEALIKSPGRVERENWIGQVNDLMKS